MNSDIAKFQQRKVDTSAFLSLKPGESAKVVKVIEIKPILKTNVKGQEVEALRLVCDVETQSGIVRKNFDNSSTKFVNQLTANDVDLGDGFTLTRQGEAQNTVYLISGVVKAGNPSTAQTATPSEATPDDTQG